MRMKENSAVKATVWVFKIELFANNKQTNKQRMVDFFEKALTPFNIWETFWNNILTYWSHVNIKCNGLG